MNDHPIEFTDEVVLTAVDYVTNRTAGPYQRWATREDIKQELLTYAYGNGKKALTKFLAGGEPHRLYLALYSVAKQYGEKEKAEASGYDFTDLAWYSPENVSKWLPLALDPVWDGTNDLSDETERTTGKAPAFEGGSLLAMVADVRGSLRACPAAALVVRSGVGADSQEYADACVELSSWLGGEFPAAPGYRREKEAA